MTSHVAEAPPPVTGDAQTWTDADRAVAALYAAHWTRLVRTAALLVRDVETAEDVVQDAFVAMHRHWGRLRDPDRALGYLRRSVVNGARSTIRHRGVVARYLSRHGREQHERTAPPAEDAALAGDVHGTVMAALAQLPPRQREVVVLRYYCDLSEAETSEHLGIGVGAVKSNGSRGLARLRALLPPEVRTEGTGRAEIRVEDDDDRS